MFDTKTIENFHQKLQAKYNGCIIRNELKEIDGYQWRLFKPKGDSKGFAIAHLKLSPDTQIITGFVHDFTTGSNETILAIPPEGKITDNMRAEMIKQRIKRIKEINQEAAQNLQAAHSRYKAGIPCDANNKNNYHGYLEIKNIFGHDINEKSELRSYNGELMIPMKDHAGEIKSYQTIKEIAPDISQKDGEIIKRKFSKRNIKLSNTKGLIHVIGDIKNARAVGFAEGYATAESLHFALEIPVVICFGCENFEAALETFIKGVPDIKKYPAAENLIIFPDTGTGETVARRVVGEYQAKGCPRKFGIVAPRPELTGDPDKDKDKDNNYDFNDAITGQDDVTVDRLHSDFEAVISNIAKIPNVIQIDYDWFCSECENSFDGVDVGIRYAIKAPADPAERQGDPNICGIRKFLPMRFYGLTIICARTGAGKTAGLTSIAATILNRDPKARVLFISLEQNAKFITARLAAAMAACMASTDIPAEAQNPKEIKMPVRSVILHAGRKEFLPATQQERLENVFTQFKGRVELISKEKAPEYSKAENIAAAIRSHYARFGYNAYVFIDYAQKMEPEERGALPYIDLQKAVDSILDATRETGLCVFLAAQNNRETANAAKNDVVAEVNLANSETLRGAADLEQAAETIIYFARDRNDPMKRIISKCLKCRGDDDLTGVISEFPCYGESSFIDMREPLIWEPLNHMYKNESIKNKASVKEPAKTEKPVINGGAAYDSKEIIANYDCWNDEKEGEKQ